ncbi:BatD family protein [Thalassotalea sp. Y01]|uniref:BatD family protein n=1 Tax=Thalassotalea sp. Y01 TaxID=2729613 RepID=UPI00145E3327|nr:BatD family protein [Thalassotalea sp. Y01]NMP17445.1 protein BatD [Thalassotalea sp. Y01]
MPVSSLFQRRVNGFANVFAKAFVISLFAVICLFLMTLSNQVQAFASQDEVTVAVSQKTEQPLVATQQVVFAIELRSQMPFAQDFSVSYIDIEGCVVIQPTGAAQSTVAQVDGETWNVQRRNVIVYPLESGDFRLPMITVNAELRNEQGQLQTRVLKTPSPSFQVTDKNLENKGQTVLASPNVSFTVSSNIDKQKSLSLGSAVTFTYTLSADKQHVLMLPKFVIEELPATEKYVKPVVDEDEFQRFKKFNIATRSQQVTYILQQEGSYVFPEQRISWWDLKTDSLQTEVIAEQTVVVGDSERVFTVKSAANEASINGEQADVIADFKVAWLYGLLVVAFIIACIRQLIVHRHALLESYKHSYYVTRKQAAKDFTMHCNRGDYQRAVDVLYRLNQAQGNAGNLSSCLSGKALTVLQKLQAKAYANNGAKSGISQEDVDLLLQAVLSANQTNDSTGNKGFKFSMKINSHK